MPMIMMNPALIIHHLHIKKTQKGNSVRQKTEEAHAHKPEGRTNCSWGETMLVKIGLLS